MQIITTVGYYHVPTRIVKWKGQTVSNISRNVKQLELSYTAGWNVKWYNYLRKSMYNI